MQAIIAARISIHYPKLHIATIDLRIPLKKAFKIMLIINIFHQNKRGI